MRAATGGTASTMPSAGSATRGVHESSFGAMEAVVRVRSTCTFAKVMLWRTMYGTSASGVWSGSSSVLTMRRVKRPWFARMRKPCGYRHREVNGGGRRALGGMV